MDRDYLQYRAIDIVCWLFPRRAVYRLGGLFAKIMFAGDARGRTAVISNLRRILRYKGENPTEAELAALALDTYRNFAKYLVDFFSFRRMSRRQVDEVVKVENEWVLEHLNSLNRGVIALTMHMSTWELAAPLLTSRGYPLNVVFFPLKSPRSAELFRMRREEKGERLIPFGHAVRATMEAFRRKEWVTLLGDVDFGAHDDLAMLCGAPARMPMGPARLSVKLKVPIVAGFIVRKPDDTFFFRVHPPIVPDENTTMEDVRERIRAIIESEILANPTHWFVFVDFWDLDANRSLTVHGGDRPEY